MLDERDGQIQTSLPLENQIESSRGYNGRTDEGSDIPVIILTRILIV